MTIPNSASFSTPDMASGVMSAMASGTSLQCLFDAMSGIVFGAISVVGGLSDFGMSAGAGQQRLGGWDSCLLNLCHVMQ